MQNEKCFIKLENINKVYANNVQAVYDFSLDINKNDFVVLVGPSGCGKSTTLRMIAGLEEITNGKLYIADKLSNFEPSKNRNIAMVFQSYALYPNMNVFNNMAFGLKIKGVDKKEIEQRVFYAAKILDLGAYLDRLPKELSGGQMQRVALGRAIVRNMPIYLMDEPLSNLDAKLRVSMRSEIVKIHREVGCTTIYVTHDQIEAMTMATKIVVMNKGFIQQIGAPEDIYRQPVNSFVATFIGTPAMNIFKCKYSDGKMYLDNGNPLNVDFDAESYKNYLEKVKQEALGYIENFTYDSIVFAKKLKSQCVDLDADNGQPIIIKKKKEGALKRFIESRKREAQVKKLRNKEKSLQKLITSFDPDKGQSLEQLNEMLLEVRQEIYQKITELEKTSIPEKYQLMDLVEKIDHNLSSEHEVLVGIRPENISIRRFNENEDADKITVVADVVELLGAEYNVYFNFQGRKMICKMSCNNKIESGERFVLEMDPQHLNVFDQLTGMRLHIK